MDAYSFLETVVVLLIIGAAIAVTVIIIVFARKRNKPYRPKNIDNGPKKENNNSPKSYKQEMYLEALRGNENSPYYESNKTIGQSTYDACADYVCELFGCEKDSDEYDKKMFFLLGKYTVLPDNNINVTWPRTNLSSLYNHRVKLPFMDYGDNQVLIIFHPVDNMLCKKMLLLFKKNGIEIKNMPKSTPRSKDSNKYVILAKDSDEMTFLNYLLRTKDAYKQRAFFGMRHIALPKQGSFEQYKVNTMKRLKLESNYEFIRCMIPTFIDNLIAISSIMHADNPKINAIREKANGFKKGPDPVWEWCKSLNKELKHELIEQEKSIEK